MGEEAKTATLLLTEAEGELVSRRWRLEVKDGPDKGRSVTRDSGTVLMGSHPNADLSLSDPTVSRYHAEFQLLAEGVMVVDLGSTNGTRVGKSRVERVLVPPGGTVRLGHTTISITPDDQRIPVESAGPQSFGKFVTSDPALQHSLAQLNRVAKTEATVLLRGETGTGKELLARAIHDNSKRENGPFVVVDCASVKDTLLESQLFGHMKGSFTGAVDDRLGAFEAGNGGTVFLDELGELPIDLQPKLLRVLESRTVRRLGDVVDRNIDVRFVAATNRDLAAMVEAGTFRSDLYYRVAVVRIKIPSIKERPEDVELLARHYAKEMSQGRIPLTPEAIATLSRYDWPGNARELRNVLERAIALSDGTPIKPSDLFPTEVDDQPGTFHEAKNKVIGEFEKRYLRSLLSRHDGNISAAAREAGLSRNAIYALMKRSGLMVD